jgi:hypothetical protein
MSSHSTDLISRTVPLLAMVAAAVFTFAIYPSIASPWGLATDPDNILDLVRNLRDRGALQYSGSGQAALDRGPVYPWVAAMASRWLPLPEVLGLQVLHVLLHGLTTWFVMRVASLLSSRRFAVVAGLIYAVHPVALWYVPRIWIETLHASVVMLVTVTVVSWWRAPEWRTSLVTGLAQGFLVLVKGTWIVLPVASACMLLLRLRGRGVAMSAGLLFTAAAVVLPWTMRNVHATGHVVPVHTSLGFNLYQGDAVAEAFPGQWCCTMELWNQGNARVQEVIGATGDFRTAESDQVLVQTWLYRTAQDPVWAMKRWGVNALTFWFLSESKMKSLMYGALQGTLLLVALAGAWKGRIVRQTFPVIFLVVLYWLAHAGVVGWARYSAPLIAPLLVIAASGWSRMADESADTGESVLRSAHVDREGPNV